MTDYSTETTEERAKRLDYKSPHTAFKDAENGELLAVVRVRVEHLENLYQEKGSRPAPWDMKLALDDLKTAVDRLRENILVKA